MRSARSGSGCFAKSLGCESVCKAGTLLKNGDGGLLCMDNLNELLQESIGLLDEIYELALKEDCERIRVHYQTLAVNINSFCTLLLQDNKDVVIFIVRLMEAMYVALNAGDCVNMLDISKYELKPILVQIFEGIGDYNG